MIKNHDAGNFPDTIALLIMVRPTPKAEAMLLRPRASAKEEVLYIMQATYPQCVEFGKSTFRGLLESPHFVKAHSMMDDDQYSEIGARLVTVRSVFSGLSQKAWSEKHGFQPTQWNNWEKGVRRIPVDAAEKLCHIYGLSLDWIYLGRRSGLAESASKVL